MLDTARKEQLDHLGQTVGIFRRPRESDQTYRGRIRLAFAACGMRGTPANIYEALHDAVPQGKIALTEAPGRVLVRIKLPLWRRLLVLPARGDRRRAREVLKELVATGVVWRLEA